MKEGNTTMRRGRRVILWFMLLMMISLFGGCGSAPEDETPITSKWELVEWTIGGKTTVIKDDPIANLTTDMLPAFSSSDGSSCVFSNNGNTHKGTLEYEGNGKYKATFSNLKPVNLVITGKRLCLSNDQRSYEIVFETK